MTESQPFSLRHREGIWKVALWFAYLFLIIRTAWVSDDALITMRVIENFVHGYGPVFNVGERVQVFTHPLWFLLLSLLYAIPVHLGITLPSQHVLFLLGTTIIISAIAMLMLLWVGLRRSHALLLGVLALFLSRGFIDYSTSGLEYPLLYLLLVIWFWRWKVSSHPRRLGELTFWLALLITTRMDVGLLLMPIWIYEVLKGNWTWRSRLQQVLLGGLPFLLWEGFSLVYYGFLFPNTFYAKVGGTGLALSHRIWRGVLYFLHTMDHDPVTLLGIGLGLAWILWLMAVKALPLTHPLGLGGLGIVLYLGYVLYIGGDFMQSRFFVPPLLWNVLLWDLLPRPQKEYLWSLVALFIMFGYSATYPVFRPQSVLNVPEETQDYLRFGYQESGIADERIYYFFNVKGFALMRASPKFPPFLHSQYQGVRWRYDSEERRVLLVGTLGENGLVFGPSVHLIDHWALADPLLSRLPAKDRGRSQRVGHMSRAIPAGYLKAVETGNPQFIQDENIRSYYEVLRIIVHGPLFDWERWKAIWAMHTGKVRPPSSYLTATEEELNMYSPLFWKKEKK